MIIASIWESTSGTLRVGEVNEDERYVYFCVSCARFFLEVDLKAWKVQREINSNILTATTAKLLSRKIHQFYLCLFREYPSLA